jgi:hypothetical protein
MAYSTIRFYKEILCGNEFSVGLDITIFPGSTTNIRSVSMTTRLVGKNAYGLVVKKKGIMRRFNSLIEYVVWR